jgi:prepilin-type N-terminal cleavage/methylation domain-containing protein
MEKTKNKKAFSLVELVVVITILTILAGIGSMSFFSYLKDGNDAKRITDIQSIKIQLDNYRRNHGYLYPV